LGRHRREKPKRPNRIPRYMIIVTVVIVMMIILVAGRIIWHKWQQTTPWQHLIFILGTLLCTAGIGVLGLIILSFRYHHRNKR